MRLVRFCGVEEIQLDGHIRVQRLLGFGLTVVLAYSMSGKRNCADGSCQNCVIAAALILTNLISSYRMFTGAQKRAPSKGL